MGAADQVRLRNPLTQLEQHGISQMIYGLRHAYGW